MLVRVGVLLQGLLLVLLVLLLLLLLLLLLKGLGLTGVEVRESVSAGAGSTRPVGCGAGNAWW